MVGVRECRRKDRPCNHLASLHAARIPKCSPRPSRRPCRRRGTWRRSKRRPCSATCRDGARCSSRSSVSRSRWRLPRASRPLLVMAIPSSQRPAGQDSASLSAAWQSVKSSRYPGAAAGAASEAYGDPGRAGRQRLRQRSGAARNSRRRSAARRVRIHQRTDGRRTADVRQAHRRRRVARAGDGDFRRFGHSAGRVHRPDAGDGGIA